MHGWGRQQSLICLLHLMLQSVIIMASTSEPYETNTQHSAVFYGISLSHNNGTKPDTLYYLPVIDDLLSWLSPLWVHSCETIVCWVRVPPQRKKAVFFSFFFMKQTPSLCSKQHNFWVPRDVRVISKRWVTGRMWPVCPYKSCTRCTGLYL